MSVPYEEVKQNILRLIKIEKTKQEFWCDERDRCIRNIKKHQENIMEYYEDLDKYKNKMENE